jgi:general secretion pathway protein D
MTMRAQPLERRQGAFATATLYRLQCALLTCGMAALSTVAPAQQESLVDPARNPALKSKTPVTMNFVNADIDAVSRAMAAMLGRQIVVDPRVKGSITVYSDQPLSVRDAYLNYLSALRGLGFAVVENGGLLKVVPEAEAKLQAGTVSVGPVGQRGDQVMTQVFRLNHESANNLVAVLRPLITPNNTINANPSNNTLVVTDYADNLQRIAKIIAAMDTPAGTDIEVIPLQHAVASDLAPIVQRLSEAGAAPGAAPGAAAGPNSVAADSAHNALLVRAASPARLATIRALVDKLDRPMEGGGPAGNIYVVHLRNADAVKLAAVLRAAYAAGIPSGTGGGAGGGAFAATSTPLQPTPTPVSGTSAQNAGGATGGAAAPITPSAGPSTGGFVQADPATNSLIITAPEPMYRQLRTMIDALDARRAQVYIESMIVEVQGDDAADIGFQWQGLLGQKGDKYGFFAGTNTSVGGANIFDLSATLAGNSTSTSSTGGTTGTGTTTGPTLPSEGLNLGLLRNYGGTYALSAIAHLLQSTTHTNIISTPNLVTLDNEEAKIIVGSNVPFITGQFTNTGTATTSPFQTIERKDVGITLRIKPQISENGTIRMTIYQESSSLSSTVAPGTSNAGPSTDKRSIESNVVVDDGQIIVLGGLIEDKYSDSKSKVPLLGDIPFVGALFRSESRTKTRTNLMIFLRPMVMRDAETTNKLSLDRYDLIRAQQANEQPSQSVLMPLSGSPVLPERGKPEVPAVPPLNPPEAAPPKNLFRPQQPQQPEQPQPPQQQ